MTQAKSLSPDRLSEAIALREAGFSVLAISQRLGVSVRTLHRHFAAHGTKKGSLKDDLVQQARDDLRSRLTDVSSIRDEAARLVQDDLAHARHLRDLLVDASTVMKAETLKDAVLVYRAAAAYSTALKNTSDMLRHSLRIDRLDDTDDEELPTLVVKVLTDDDVARIRESQRAGTDNLDVIDDADDFDDATS
jgi:AcrR family transcriptional regulator